MSPGSQDSAFDIDRFEERINHTVREPSPDAQTNAETDFAALGALFGDRRESDPRPNSLEISEGEEMSMHPSHRAWHNQLFSNADAVASGNRISSRSPATPTPTPTPTPTQPHIGSSYIQPSDMAQFREQRGRRGRRARRNNRGPGSHSSFDTLERGRRASDTSNDDGDYEEIDERGRSVTPTPYPLQSYTPSRGSTPSHRSQQTEEEHGEGQGPLSPNPWSPLLPYNAQQQQRTEAISGVDEHFPADQQSRAE